MVPRVLEGNENPLADAEAQSRDMTAGRQRTFKKGEVLWAAGEEPDTVWTVQKGHAFIEISGPEGVNAIVQVCTQGHTLCPAAAMTGGAMPCRAVASADLVATAVPRHVFMRAFDALPLVGRHALEQVAADFCQSHVERSQAATSVKNRLAKLLERLHIQFGGAALPFSGQELADMSGTRQETVSRTLVPWKRSGVIRGSMSTLEVLHSAQLESFHD